MVHSALGVSVTVNGTTSIKTKKGDSGWVLYGPYLELPAGFYQVSFQITPSGFTSDAERREICGFVDVCRDDGTHILSKNAFSAEQLINVDVLSIFEFRVFSTGVVGLVVQSNRFLTVDQGYFDAAVSSKKFLSSLISKSLTYNVFFIQNILHFESLADRGALITPVNHVVVVDLFGIKINVQNLEDFQIINEILLHNEYNFAINRNVCVIDVGMNVGLASLYFANLSYVREVHAFEPFKAPFDRALANFALNPNLSKKIMAYNFGIGNQNTNVDVLYSDQETISVSTRGASQGLPSSILIRDAGEVLSDVIAEAQAKELKIVVKMDCEGSEFPVFERLIEKNLLSNISVFLIEWHKWWSVDKTQLDLIKPLLDADFVVFDQTRVTNPHAGSLYAVRG